MIQTKQMENYKKMEVYIKMNEKSINLLQKAYFNKKSGKL